MEDAMEDVRDCIVLAPDPEAPPSPRPPVRLFVGTETGQRRAERVFVWSVVRARNPARRYEIHLMRDLPGFDRRRWLTGFTGYRFAVPALAGGSGRAIFNDVDQVYLADPGELFDLPMGGHGVLTVPKASADATPDTSVMLLDCARMSRVWTLESAQRERKATLLARLEAEPGLRGDLDPAWNACDVHEPGRMRLLHFTTIHAQPWQPFPAVYAYQRNPVAGVFDELEAEADRAGFQVFSAERPSRAFRSRRAQRPAPPPRPEADVAREWRELQERLAPETLLEVTTGPPSPDTRSSPAPVTHVWTPGSGEPAAERVDAVRCLDALDAAPDADVPWLVEALFRRARRAVFAVASLRPGPAPGQSPWPGRTPRFWDREFTAASARHPHVEWRLVLRGPGGRVWVRQGGPRPAGGPRVWVLSDGKPGHTTQSVGLAEALGWPFEVRELRFRRRAAWERALTRLFGRLPASCSGVRRDARTGLTPPWPDLVITTGWRGAPVARWIAEQSGGRTRTVVMGRQGGWLAEAFDAVVTCRHFDAPPHPARIETLLPLHRISTKQLAQARARTPGPLEDAPRPLLVVLVGGSTRRFVLDAQGARRLAARARQMALERGGSVLAVTSRRTGSEATAILEGELADVGRVDRWAPDRDHNPYLDHLAAADAILVTGESESMLAEALACGVPVATFPLAERPGGLPARIQAALVAGSRSTRRSRRGQIRPQRGLQRILARAVERGVVRPRRDLAALHAELRARGLAHPPESVWTATATPFREAEAVAEALRRRLGLPGG